MSEEQTQADPGTAKTHSIGRELAVIAASLSVGALLLFGAYRFWQYETLHPSTENASLQANYVWISPQIGGRVAQVAVRDDQRVQRGQLLLVDYYHWEIVTAGMVIGAFGILGLAGGILSPHLAARVGVRRALTIGCLFLALGWYLFSRINLNSGPADIFLSGALIEFGLMLCYPILAAQAFANLRPEQRDEGAGLFNFMETLGFSFGVTFVEILIYRGNQANWNEYAGFISLTNPGLDGFLSGPGMDPMSGSAGALLGAELAGQTSMLSIVQSAEVMTLLALFSIPLVLMLRAK